MYKYLIALVFVNDPQKLHLKKKTSSCVTSLFLKKKKILKKS